MGIKTQKALRLISKICLLIVGVVLIGYGGLVVYKSVINRPQKVRVSNVTDSGATITWVTQSPVRGVVYYKDVNKLYSGPLGFLFSNVGYDDRDFATAQVDCVNEFNEHAKNTKDENFAVNGDNFDCENIKVEKLGAYYTHSVTLKNLNEGSTYYFRVGNGIWSWDINGVGKDISENELALATEFSFVTGKISETIPTPNIAYGTVYAGAKEEGADAIYEALSKDSLVFAYLTTGESKSQLISSVTNTQGGWIMDKSNLRNADGELITDLTGATLTVCAQYQDVNPRECAEVDGDLTEDTVVDLIGNSEEDVLDTYQKNIILEKFNQLVSRVYATASMEGHDPNRCKEPGVSGCSLAAECIKKCPVTGTNMFDWVKYGTVAAGDCSLPSFCGGCTATDAARNCVDGTPNDNHSKWCKLQSGAYFWNNYTNDTCNVAPPACSPTHCTYAYGGDHYLMCVDGVPKVFTNSTCTDSDSGTTCYPVNCTETAPGVWKKCVDGSPKEFTNSQCSSSCTRPTTCEVTGASSSKICTGGVLYTYPDTNCGVHTCDGHDIGYCVEVERTHKICTSTGWSTTLGGCDTDDVPSPSSSDKCVVRAKYNEEGELSECAINCGGDNIVKLTDATKCREHLTEEIGSNIPSADGEQTVDTELYTVEIDPFDLSTGRIKTLIDSNANLRARGISAMEDCVSEGSINSSQEGDNCQKICKAMDGSYGSVGGNAPFSGCFDSDGNPITSLINNLLVPKAYAEETSTKSANSYSSYLPEVGMYGFEIDGGTVANVVSDGDTIQMFYVEANNKEGFQMPADPENPTKDEDIVLSTNVYEITYSQKSTGQKYEIKKGINLVAFDFVPTAIDSSAYTANDVIAQASDDGVDIQYISTFDGGRWINGYSCTSDVCTGSNFIIVPGKGYLVYATEDGTMTIPGYSLKTSIPVALSSGWNLVGVHGYTTAYTARSFIDSINTIKGLTANNVSGWTISKSMYEGLEVEKSAEYGLDFPIDPLKGYFVRISEFAPTNTKCKSLIWNSGGDLNGSCGNSR